MLEAYYEPQFKDNSHGFRPQRGCHTALMEIKRNWTGTNWFIEGDIKGCFDNIHHAKLLEVIGRSIKDGKFIHLLKDMLKIGSIMKHIQAHLKEESLAPCSPTSCYMKWTSS